MKAIIFIVMFLGSITLHGQEIVKINDKVSVTLPKKAVKFKDTEAIQDLTAAFGEKVSKNLVRNTYKIGDITINLKPTKQKIDGQYLLKRKEATDSRHGETGKGKGNAKQRYSSEIKQVKSGQVLIVTRYVNALLVHDFYWVDSSSKYALVGAIKSKKGDLKNSVTVLNQILDGITVTP